MALLVNSLVCSQPIETKEKTLFEKGMVALEKKDTQSAIEFFEKSGKSEKNPEAYFELSQIFAGDTTVDSYNKSREMIKEAIKLDGRNIKYYMYFGEVLKVLFKINIFDKDALLRAENQYNKVLEIDSTYSPAYYELAKLYERYFYENYGNEEVKVEHENKIVDQFKWRTRADKTPLVGNKVISSYKDNQVKEEWNNYLNNLFEEGHYASLKMDDEAERIFQKAFFYFAKTNQYDDSNINSYYKPAVMYTLTKKYEKAIEILNSANGRFLSDSDFNLAYAYNYYKLKNFAESQKHFETAFTLMNNERRFEYKVGSVLEILNPSFAEKLQSMSREKQEMFLTQYWQIKDPLLLSPENERLLEHYSRVFYADCFLSSYDPYIYFPNEIDTTGWKTERGIVAIRYGEPIEKRTLLPSYETAALREKGLGTSAKTDFWDYGDFKLSFNELSHRRNFKMGGYNFMNDAVTYSNNSIDLYKDLIAKTPERYIPEFKGPVIDLPFNVYQLKDNDRTTVYLTYALPEIKDSNSLAHKYGVFYFNNKIKPL